MFQEFLAGSECKESRAGAFRAGLPSLELRPDRDLAPAGKSSRGDRNHSSLQGIDFRPKVENLFPATKSGYGRPCLTSRQEPRHGPAATQGSGVPLGTPRPETLCTPILQGILGTFLKMTPTFIV